MCCKFLLYITTSELGSLVRLAHETINDNKLIALPGNLGKSGLHKFYHVPRSIFVDAISVGYFALVFTRYRVYLEISHEL